MRFRLELARHVQSPYNQLSILSMRFDGIPMPTLHERPVGYFQFSLWDSVPEKSLVKQLEDYDFQFSLWDSAHGRRSWSHGPNSFQFSLWDSWLKNVKESEKNVPDFQFSLWDSCDAKHSWREDWFAFNSLYEIRDLARRLAYCETLLDELSILSMRFTISNSDPLSFQLFSFNSLYEIPTFQPYDKSRTVTRLSILSMRFNSKTSFLIMPSQVFFQFSLWDSVLFLGFLGLSSGILLKVG